MNAIWKQGPPKWLTDVPTDLMDQKGEDPLEEDEQEGNENGDENGDEDGSEGASGPTVESFIILTPPEPTEQGQEHGQGQGHEQEHVQEHEQGLCV